MANKCKALKELEKTELPAGKLVQPRSHTNFIGLRLKRPKDNSKSSRASDWELLMPIIAFVAPCITVFVIFGVVILT
jgi:hypothetical protein